MKNIQNLISLSLLRGIPYAKWGHNGYKDSPNCMLPIPNMFTTRRDDHEFSINLNNIPHL